MPSFLPNDQSDVTRQRRKSQRRCPTHNRALEDYWKHGGEAMYFAAVEAAIERERTGATVPAKEDGDTMVERWFCPQGKNCGYRLAVTSTMVGGDWVETSEVGEVVLPTPADVLALPAKDCPRWVLGVVRKLMDENARLVARLRKKLNR